MHAQTPRKLIAFTRSKFADLVFVGDVGDDAERLMVGGGEFVGGGAQCGASLMSPDRTAVVLGGSAA